jgi:hypothetical protein
MSPKVESPTFLEVMPGVFIAANVKAPELIDFRQGQNLFDQPPLNWLLSSPDLLPSDWDFDEEAGQRLSKIMVHIAVTKHYCFPTTITHPSPSKQQRHGEINILGGISQFRDVMKRLGAKYYGLLPLDLDDNAQMIQFIQIIGEIVDRLDEYPLLIEYLKEFWVKPDIKVFDGEGRPTKTNGEFTLPSYVVYRERKRKSKSNKDDYKWVGLDDILPDSSAALSTTETEATDQDFPGSFNHIIIRVIKNLPESHS